jgi:hypothetical protein
MYVYIHEPGLHKHFTSVLNIDPTSGTVPRVKR